MDALAAPGHGEAHTVAIGGGQDDLATVLRQGLDRVLHQVEEDLDELVVIAKHGGQGWIVILDEPDLAPKTVLGELAHPVEDLVDVDRAALERNALGEYLHAINDGADAVRLFPDELGQG